MALTIVVGLTACVAVILGGMAAAWRRACVVTAHTIRDVIESCYQTSYAAEKKERLSQQEIIGFTPRWVSLRHVLALTFWLITAVLSLFAFTWYWAIAIALGTYVLMETVGFLFPVSSDPYYVRRIHRSFGQSLAVAERFGNSELVADYRERIREIELVYARELSAYSTSEVPKVKSVSRD